ncbi:unnamed protein product [Orchesella dallaii]|uniref:Uncharacterized protein n=1 Tax=Orchesella dallaii TaxID=48710 RepID=A0ABP1QH32_9HEXA
MLIEQFLRFSPADDVASIVGKFAAILCIVILTLGIISGLAYVICYIIYRSWDQSHPDGDATKCRFCYPANPEDNLKCIYVHDFTTQCGNQGLLQEAACGVVAQASILNGNQPSNEKECLPLTKSDQEIKINSCSVAGVDVTYEINQVYAIIH